MKDTVSIVIGQSAIEMNGSFDIAIQVPIERKWLVVFAGGTSTIVDEDPASSVHPYPIGYKALPIITAIGKEVE